MTPRMILLAAVLHGPGRLVIAAAVLAALCTGIAAAGPTVITGVPDYQQTDFTGNNDCAPVAAATVLGYWDSHGYALLIDGPASFLANPRGVTDLVQGLKSAMQWSSTGVQLVLIAPGIAAVAAERGHRFWAFTHYAMLWDDLKGQADAGRPALFTIMHPAYLSASHTVACTGYDEQSSTRIAIVHDNWNTTPEDVYLNYDECYGKSLTAVVQPECTHALTVNSSPIGGIVISGTQPGSTAYAAGVPDLMPVRLIAPYDTDCGGARYRFVRWIVDGIEQPPALDSASFGMAADRAAVAVYEKQPLPGDANRDCKVNILDLIFVRNRLGRSPLSGDNWQADQNLDGRIDVLDLLVIRRYVGTLCPP